LKLDFIKKIAEVIAAFERLKRPAELCSFVYLGTHTCLPYTPIAAACNARIRPPPAPYFFRGDNLVRGLRAGLYFLKKFSKKYSIALTFVIYYLLVSVAETVFVVPAKAGIQFFAQDSCFCRSKIVDFRFCNRL